MYRAPVYCPALPLHLFVMTGDHHDGAFFSLDDVVGRGCDVHPVVATASPEVLSVAAVSARTSTNPVNPNGFSMGDGRMTNLPPVASASIFALPGHEREGAAGRASLPIHAAQTGRRMKVSPGVPASP